jgi:hypothetical protein
MTAAFNLSQFANNVNTSGQASLTAAVSGTLPVANGGTGAVSLTANNVILGNGTGAVQTVAPSTSGNVLQSNGSTWVSATFAPYSGFSTVIFASSTTWSVPTGITQARITVIGGGGGGATNTGTATSYSGGSGGLAIAYCTGLNGTLTITIGVGGASRLSSTVPAQAGTASSITGTGVSITASGGIGATTSANGAHGAGLVTTGTALSSGAAVINGLIRGGTSSGITVAGNAYDYYIGGSIAIARNQAVDNPSAGGAGAVFAVGGQVPAGVGGYGSSITKSCGGLVIIEY